MAGGIPPAIPIALTGASLLGIGPKIGPRDPSGRVHGVNLLGLAGLGMGLSNALANMNKIDTILEGMKTGVAPSITATPQSLQLASQISTLMKAGMTPEQIKAILSPNLFSMMFRRF